VLESMIIIISISFWDDWVLGKTLWKPFNLGSDWLQVVCGLIHADVNGPMSVMSPQGSKYYVCFNEDYNNYPRLSSTNSTINFPIVYVRSQMNFRLLVPQ
jgi:hypothetical protein